MNLRPLIAWCVAWTLLGSASHAGEVVRVAGGGEREADNVPAAEARLNEPFAVDFDEQGNMYIAEMVGGRILRVAPDGMLTRLAGREQQDDAGDGGPSTAAIFNGMHHLVYAPKQALLIADTWNSRVRRIDLATATIAPFAGSGEQGFGGDGGPALRAAFGGVYCLAMSADQETLYLADLDNRRIRAVEVATGIVSTVAGNGERGVPRDGALAVESPLVDPRAVAVDSKRNLYILERSGHALRKVDSSGRIRTVAGTGAAGPAGDRDDALQAQFNGPKHLSIDGDDKVLIADTENHVIRKYLPSERKVIRIAGSGKQGAAGEGGDPLTVELNRPHGVIAGPDGDLYIADSSNHRVLRVSP